MAFDDGIAQANKLGISGDTDRFNIELEADHQYQLELIGARNGTSAPLEGGTLSHFPAERNLEPVTLDLASSERGYVRLEQYGYTPETSGVLTVEVAASNDLDTGRYKVQLVDLGIAESDEAPNSITDFNLDADTSLTLGDSLQASLQSEQDIDLYSLLIDANQRVQVNVKGFDQAEGTLAQATLRLLTETGQLVAVGTLGEGGVQLDATVLDSTMMLCRDRLDRF